MANGRDIVVVGASMGGVEALTTLAAQLPSDFGAAMFVVQHTSPEAPGYLGRILSGAGPLPAVVAEDGMPIERGRIYVAPPDRHMLLSPSAVRILFGPRENRARPAINPLFRTAAVHFSSRVIGVILTGMLDDGALGLLAVKRCGGVAVVQAVEDAAYPDMPSRALEAVDADHVEPLASIGPLLARLTEERAPSAPSIPKDVQLEARLAERSMVSTNSDDHPGREVPYTCPDCGGTLRVVEDERLRQFRCHVGHAFSEATLLSSQKHAVEDALWVALRTLNERTRMLEGAARHETEGGRPNVAALYEQRASESRDHEQTLKTALEEFSVGG